MNNRVSQANFSSPTPLALHIQIQTHTFISSSTFFLTETSLAETSPSLKVNLNTVTFQYIFHKEHVIIFIMPLLLASQAKSHAVN